MDKDIIGKIIIWLEAHPTTVGLIVAGVSGIGGLTFFIISHCAKKKKEDRDKIEKKKKEDRDKKEQYRKEIITPYMSSLKELQNDIISYRSTQLHTLEVITEDNKNIILKTIDVYNGIYPVFVDFMIFVSPKHLKLYYTFISIIQMIFTIFVIVYQKNSSEKEKNKLYLILYTNIFKIIGITEECLSILDSTIIYESYDGNEEDQIEHLNKINQTELQVIIQALSITQEEIDNILNIER